MKSRNFRSLICMLLTFVLIPCTFSTAFAAGTETWNSIRGPEEAMRIVNYNLTPVKTIGSARDNCYLYIGYQVMRCDRHGCNCTDSEPSNWSPVKITTQIRTTSGSVLAQGITPEVYTFNSWSFTEIRTSRKMRAGEKVQIYMDISSNGTSPGVNRRGHILYYYRFDTY